MIHNDVQNQLALLVKTSATPLIEVATSPVETPQWVPGQRLPAHVIASLPNGRFHVMVEDQTLDMNLPRNTQSGDTLELVYVSSNPRHTFALSSDVLKAISLPGQQVELSTTGKLLGNLIQPSQTNTTPVAPLAQSTPLLPGAPLSVQQLATVLQDAISNSGLFYESHQAQWVMGERPLESLLREPQGKLSASVQQPPSSLQRSISEAEGKQLPAEKVILASQGQANAAAVAANAPVPRNLEDVHSFSATAGSTSVSVKEPIHPQTTTLVQQQLNMVDNRHVVWQGQVWSGQDMKWEIEEEGRRNAYGEEEKTWHTRLHINFPVLGGLTARIALLPAGVKVDFSVMEESSMALMQKESLSLLQSIESSGLRVTGLSVGRGVGS